MACLFLTGCDKDPSVPVSDAPRSEKNDMVVGEDIKEDDIREFYYTIENINLDSYYLRYKYYAKDGKRMFFFEERERPGEYGPTTEDDTIAKTEFELTDKEWSKFCEIIAGGTVRERNDDPEDGGRGPWTYLYWTGDEDKYQEYSFESQSSRKSFEQLSESLVKKSGTMMKSEDELRNPPEPVGLNNGELYGEWMGYHKDVSGGYYVTLDEPDASGCFPFEMTIDWVTSSDGGMNVETIEIKGNAVPEDEGFMTVNGIYDDGSNLPESDRSIKLTLEHNDKGLKIKVIESKCLRLNPGDIFELTRE